jgi:hypothetical protein
MCNVKFQQWASNFAKINKLKLNHKILEENYQVLGFPLNNGLASFPIIQGQPLIM